jgi:YggT family protein
MNQALIFLLQTFLGLFSLALLLRFFMQAVRAPARNPLSNFVAALTNFAVLPARRVIPGLWGYDLSSLLLAWTVEIALVLAVRSLSGYEFGSAVGTAAVGVLLLAGMHLVRLFIYIVMFATFLQAILSWINPYSPAMPIVQTLTRPFLGLFRRRVPLIGGVELSQLLVLVLCQLLLLWPVGPLEAYFAAMR